MDTQDRSVSLGTSIEHDNTAHNSHSDVASGNITGSCAVSQNHKKRVGSYLTLSLHLDSEHRFQATVLKDRASYLRYCLGHFTVKDKPYSARNTSATFFHCHHKEGDSARDFGEVVFYRDMFNCGVVAHEVTHCLLAYFRVNNKNVNGVDEEEFCERLDHYAQTIMGWYEDTIKSGEKSGHWEESSTYYAKNN